MESITAERIDPLVDTRWDELVEHHADASLFHSSAWLRALARTYGYKPLAFVGSRPGKSLKSGVVFCQVESWLTGRRLVSLPFSDHCEPLVETERDLDGLAAALDQEFRRGKWRYIEMRPVTRQKMSLSLPCSGIPYTLHLLDLSPSAEILFRSCHKDSTQRKIRRAEREGLRYREGLTPELMDIFYRFHAITRSRHHRPPQPKLWFMNLMKSFPTEMMIRVAFHQKSPIAAILTIRHKNTLVYKYGGSDPRWNHLGSMHLLLWSAILEAKAAGLQWFDFGRTEMTHQGLITFKKRWGTKQIDLTYSRYGEVDRVTPMFEQSEAGWKSKMVSSVLAHMDTTLLSLAGRALYRHVG